MVEGMRGDIIQWSKWLSLRGVSNMANFAYESFIILASFILSLHLSLSKRHQCCFRDILQTKKGRQCIKQNSHGCSFLDNTENLCELKRVMKSAFCSYVIVVIAWIPIKNTGFCLVKSAE